MNIALINPRYPYGKDSVFLNGSLSSIGSRLLAMGHDVDLIDLNIDRITDPNTDHILRSADRIGISLTGSPHIPGVLNLIDELRSRGIPTPVLLGGWVIQQLSEWEFGQMIACRSNVIQIRTEEILAQQLGCAVEEIPSAYAVSFIPFWQKIGADRMAEYLRHEGTLVVSQGCNRGCSFCAAPKNMRETFRDVAFFETDLRYLADLARRNGMDALEFYASSLDFFQTPSTVVKFLQALARVRKDSSINIRVRCLSRLDSFIEATKKISNLDALLREAGLWCIGFGADGTDPSVWKAQRKDNKEHEIIQCLELCEQFGVTPELLMVFGFPQDTPWTLAKTVITCFVALLRWPSVVIRPYMCKTFVPGNKGWMQDNRVEVAKVVADPRLFYNLDFAAIASPLTHPRRFHRYACNMAYLLLCGLLTPTGKCTTSPLLPQGGRGIMAKVARWVNWLMPFDR